MPLVHVTELKDIDLAVPCIVFDPTGRWPHTDYVHHLKACGFIPEWVNQIFRAGTQEDVEARVMSIYRMGGNPFEGHEIDAEGIMSYKGDPDVYPIALMQYRTAKVYQYPSAWVLFRVKGKPDHVYRMD